MTTVKSFTIYKEFNDLIKLLKDDQKEAMVVYAIWKYMFEDEYIYLDEDQLAIFNNLKRPLDKIKIKSKNKLNKIKIKSNQNENEIKTKTHQDVNVNVYVNDNVNVNKEYYKNKELNNLFIEFLKIRKKIKAVNSERAINNLLNKLSNYDDETKKQMINNSITNSWKDVYEIKNNLKPEYKSAYERTQENIAKFKEEMKAKEANNELRGS